MLHVIEPQKGFQEKALSTPADIAIIGGSAGGGKTAVLLLEGGRHIDNGKFTGTIFRRTTPQITAQGGLWDTSQEFYPFIGGMPREHKLDWLFPSGARVGFKQIQHEKDLLQWQGSQIPYIAFDELTHFTKRMFIYMMSRNRSMSGVKPYIRASCNPDPESWVADLIKWWIDQDTGFPIEERIGVIRYMTNKGGNFIWGDSKQEVLDKCPHLIKQAEKAGLQPFDLIKSFTFITGSVYENRLLLAQDPTYISNLEALDPEEKRRLLDGNWLVSLDGLEVFNHRKIDHLFDNYVDHNSNTRHYITCDAARFGRDLCVIAVWKGWEVVEIHVYKKSETSDIVDRIEKLRKKYLIHKDNVVIDQDGVGGRAVAKGKYRGFGGGKPVMKDPETRIKENYKNLKTQCYYRFGELRVNAGLVQLSIDPDSCYIYEDSRDNQAGERTTKIKIGSEICDVRDLIKADFKAIKRAETDKEGKQQINTKEEQKTILGRSPDFGDTFMMREYFELLGERGTMRKKN